MKHTLRLGDYEVRIAGDIEAVEVVRVAPPEDPPEAGTPETPPPVPPPNTPYRVYPGLPTWPPSEYKAARCPLCGATYFGVHVCWTVSPHSYTWCGALPAINVGMRKDVVTKAQVEEAFEEFSASLTEILADMPK